jgi:hypothetical protein
MRRISLLVALALAGCGTSDPCADDPALCNDAGSLVTCTGTCLSMQDVEPYPWTLASLLWLGPEGSQMPACPPGAAAITDPGYADAPPTMLACPPCTCTQSLGECFLPAMMSANRAPCPGVAAEAIPFDAPEIWDGTCTAMDAVPSAASLDVPPPALFGTSMCEASDAPPVSLAGGTTRALVCSNTDGEEPGACANPGDTCALGKAAGFLYCILAGGDQACPTPWPDKHLVFFDFQECNCSCGPPTGDTCTSTISVYSDSACMQPLGSAMVSSDQPDMCIDITPSSPLGSKSATPPIYQPVTCMPSETQSLPTTLCCQPETAP